MLESIAKLAPYIFYAASLIFLIIAAIHIKHLRKKDLDDEIALQESQINEKYDNYSDDDVVAAINELESGSGVVTTKKQSGPL